MASTTMRFLTAIAAALAVTSALPTSTAAVDSAEQPDGSTSFMARVQKAPQGDSSVEAYISGIADPVARLKPAIDRSQEARAFSLQPTNNWGAETELVPVPAGRSGLSTANMDRVIWLAKNYYNSPNRLPLNAELRAHQLAIWSFSAGVDLESLMEDNEVVRRAQSLAAKADEDVTTPARNAPLTGVRLTLDTTESFLKGERLAAHLTDLRPDPTNISGALIRFAVDGTPIRMMQSDKNGKVELDVPSDRKYIGNIQATWSGEVPAGTLMEGDATRVILLEPLAVTATSNPQPHSAATDPYAFTSRLIGPILTSAQQRLPGWLLIFLGGLAVFGIYSLVAKRFEGVRLRIFVGVVAISGVVVLGSSYLVDREQSHILDTSWTRTPSLLGEAAALAPVKVLETSELRGSHADFYSALCAFDGSFFSTWESARFTGTGEIIAALLAQPSMVTSVTVLPGYYENEELYNATGKPARLQIFSDRGMLQEFDIPPTEFSNTEPLPLDIDPPGIAADRFIFVRVSRIEGDVRGNAALAELGLSGAAIAQQPESASTIDYQTVTPRLREANSCTSPLSPTS